MDIRQFVSETLTQIVEGVTDANQRLSDDSEVNPRCGGTPEGKPYVEYYSELRPVELVDFDLAVTVTEGTGAKGGLGVAAGFIGLGGQKSSESSAEAVSRVKFTLPLMLPRGRDRSEERLEGHTSRY